jgi:hypothetical protein
MEFACFWNATSAFSGTPEKPLSLFGFRPSPVTGKSAGFRFRQGRAESSS